MIEGDIFVLVGSILKMFLSFVYEILIELVVVNGVKVVVDVSGKILLDVVFYKLFFIKLNYYEFVELFDVEVNSVEDVLVYGKKFVE